MTNSILKTMKGLLLAAGLAACAMTGSARAQVYVGPPPEYIATVAPVYFEGRAAYWYGNRWYYRDGGAWRWYDNEPGYLRDWRVRRAPVRQFYGRGHWGGYRRR